MVDIKNVKKGKKLLTSDKECSLLINGIKNTLNSLKYDGGVVKTTTKRCSLKVSGIRLSNEYVQEKGYNISHHTGRRGRALNWDQWVNFHNSINDVFDKKNLSANIQTLGGVFIVRDQDGRKSEDDWEERKYDNVGSMMNPVPRYRAWLPER